MRTDDNPDHRPEAWLVIHAHDNDDGLSGVHLWHWSYDEIGADRGHDLIAAAMRACGVPDEWKDHPTQAWQVSFMTGRPAAYFGFDPDGTPNAEPREGVTVHDELPDES